MDRELQSRILQKLQNKPCIFHEIRRHVGGNVPKKMINQVLYRLRDQGRIEKISDSPPTWGMKGPGRSHGGGGSSRNLRFQRGSRGGRPRPPQPTRSLFTYSQPAMPTTERNLQAELLQLLLRSTHQPRTALQLAKDLNLTSRKDVNPTLYRMEKQGLVRLIQASPPLWTIQSSSSSTSSDFGHVSPSPSDYSQQSELSSRSSSTSELAFSDQFNTMALQTPSEVSGDSTPQSESMEHLEEEEYDEDLVKALEGIDRQDLPNRIMAVLQTRPDHLFADTELMKKIGVSVRRDVTDCLRNLEAQGHVMHTVNQFPMLWGLHTHPKFQSKLPTSSSSASFHSGPSPALSGSLPQTSFNASMVADLSRNPVSTLLEFCQANKLEAEFKEVREFGPPHHKHFVVAACFNGLSFEAESTTKKEAKRMAADLAVQHIRATQIPSDPTNIETGDLSGCQAISYEGGVTHDRIAELAHSHHARLERAAKVPQPGRKVIACFMMYDEEKSTYSIVSFGSGTRCITGDKMSLRGDVVNDSHAEIVARRGLIRYFYQQLLLFHKHGPSEENIFQQASDMPQMAKVKERFTFHLYISTAPCGDGAQFSRDDLANREPPENGIHNPTMSGKSQGVLRTKMEGGEGTIPVADAQPQTWDGILQGGRLRTMSCSDKVASWNVLGLQGALLSHFMLPVYMSSLTLGSLHHHGHLSRATCCRLRDLASSVSSPYKVQHPLLGRVQGGDEMKRHTEKTTNHCMNWAFGDQVPEVTDGVTGRPIAVYGGISQVCKAEMYKLFLSLSKLTNKKHLILATYYDSKQSSTQYQQVKRLFYQHCQQRGLGMWMSKPPETDQFGPSDISTQ